MYLFALPHTVAFCNFTGGCVKGQHIFTLLRTAVNCILEQCGYIAKILNLFTLLRTVVNCIITKRCENILDITYLFTLLSWLTITSIKDAVY